MRPLVMYLSLASGLRQVVQTIALFKVLTISPASLSKVGSSLAFYLFPPMSSLANLCSASRSTLQTRYTTTVARLAIAKLAWLQLLTLRIMPQAHSQTIRVPPNWSLRSGLSLQLLWVGRLSSYTLIARPPRAPCLQARQLHLDLTPLVLLHQTAPPLRDRAR